MKTSEIIKTFPCTTFAFFMLIAIAIMLTTGCAGGEAREPVPQKPQRLSIVSQKVDLGKFCNAFVMKDSESGREFFVVTNSDGPAICLIPKNPLETER